MATDPKTSAALRLLLLFVLAAAGCTSSQDGGTGPAPDPATRVLAATVREAAHPLTGDTADYDSLLALIGDARVVLLGEATHGTHEFYRERARITQRLIREKGFTLVAVEADWPRAYRANRYVRGTGGDPDADRALAGFTEFPQWMWRNTDVRDLVEWMRAHNQTLPSPAGAVGFYGLDLYSLGPSADAVIAYLDGVDPAAAERARERYGCFRRFREDPVEYGRTVESGRTASCQAQVAQQLEELQSRAADPSDDEHFDALQNARVVQNGEAYYRAMFTPGVSTWNLRDRHMAETLDLLLQHFGRNGEPAKVVVWEHNSHIGDARATHMGDQGELNLGQLARERYGRGAVLVGFTTYAGTVIAASEWGGSGQRKTVRPALPESYEAVLHATELPSFLVPLRDGSAAEGLRPARLERAIGVVYLPQSERVSHYFHARLPEQFDAVIHWDQTRAVEPLRPAR